MLCIRDAYTITDKKEMEKILVEALLEAKIYKTKRSLKNLKREWISHNRMYKLHLFRSHTKDCDFESKQKLWVKIVYFIWGW